jgi:hypothetical protein
MVYKRAVPKGYKHNWTYHGHWKETKTRPGNWKFTFRATKSRKTAKSMGSFGVGTKGAWKIRGTQYITKIGKGKYQTKLVGTKTPMKFYVKKPFKSKRRFKRFKY